MLASSTSALPGISRLAAAGSTDLLVLLHKLVLGRAPGGDHGIKFFCGVAHRFEFRLAASLLRGYEEAQTSRNDEW